MSAGHGPHFERLTDLLSDRAVQGLSHEEAAELERLLAADNTPDPESFERAAAALDLAFSAGNPGERLPSHVFARIEAAGVAQLRDEAPPAPAPSQAANRVPGSSRRWGVGLALAASLAIAALGWWRALSTPSIPSPEATRSRVLAAADRVDWTWSAWAAKPAAEGGEPFPAAGVTGDVSWSTSQQAGVMRFAGLPRNNPEQSQYQLWIIDPAQKHPIDGGVFNVDREGEVLVNIDPKIRVSGVAAFAITVEKPGGVVVSDQSRRVVIAAAPAGKG